MYTERQGQGLLFADAQFHHDMRAENQNKQVLLPSSLFSCIRNLYRVLCQAGHILSCHVLSSQVDTNLRYGN